MIILSSLATVPWLPPLAILDFVYVKQENSLKRFSSEYEFNSMTDWF